MIKGKSKKNVYSAKLIKFQGDAKKNMAHYEKTNWLEWNWEIVFSSRNCIDKTEIVGKAKNANEFNKLFVNIGP